MRPKAPRQVIRQFSYVYAAVAPEQGLMTSLILPHADTEMMNLFLAQVAQDFADYFVVMQVDQASWHRAKDLQVEDEYSLNLSTGLQPRDQSRRASVGGIAREILAQSSLPLSGGPD